ncbi:MAG: adenosylcobinamide-GDP ribazoletransferase [bacterium]|nr:adenosylcobinamide-GDP ribazoletransferase [bacterium]
MKHFLIALQFLTIFPIKINGELKEEDFGKSLIYFPVVGVLIGLVLVLSLFILRSLPIYVESALILIISIFIYGGMHLDGFIDTCDGFYGNNPPEKILEIMKDSHVGAMGVIGIVCLLIFKYSLLLSLLILGNLWKIIFLMAVFSKFMQVVACYKTKYPRKEGKARHFVGKTTLTQLIFGLIFTAGLFAVLLKINGIIIFILSAVVILLIVNWFKKKIGGMTGDTIGAVSEISEIMVLFFGLIIIEGCFK